MVVSVLRGGDRQETRSGRLGSTLYHSSTPSIARAAIGLLPLLSGCGTQASKDQPGNARDSTAIEGDTAAKESRRGLGDMFRLPEPVDEDAEPSEEDDTSDSQ
jgi:hypothetical protein